MIFEFRCITLVLVFSLSGCREKTTVAHGSPADGKHPSGTGRSLPGFVRARPEKKKYADIQNFKERWHTLDSGSEADNRIAKCNLIRELAEKGLHSEILTYILQTTNPGDIRREYIDALFSSRDGLSLRELENSIGLLEDTGDKKAALDAILYAMSSGFRENQFSDFSDISPKAYGYELLLRRFAIFSMGSGTFEGGDAALGDNFRSICSELGKLKQSQAIDDNLFFKTISDLVAADKGVGKYAYSTIILNPNHENVPQDLRGMIIKAAAADQGIPFLDGLLKS